MKLLVIAQELLELESLFAEITFEGSLEHVRDLMALQILLRLELLVAVMTVKLKVVDVGGFMTQQI